MSLFELNTYYSFLSKIKLTTKNILNLCYKYENINNITKVSIKPRFKESLNNNKDFKAYGQVIWKCDSPLPDPNPDELNYNVTDMSNMFQDCQNIRFLDLSLWTVKNNTNLDNMFLNTPNLKYGFLKNIKLCSDFNKNSISKAINNPFVNKLIHKNSVEPSGNKVCISLNGSGNKSGSDWANAAEFSNIQNILNNSQSGTNLYFLEGLYKINSTLIVPNDINIFGGFPSEELPPPYVE